MVEEIVLRHRPEGLLADGDVELVERQPTELSDGQARGRVLMIPMDATVRSWLQDSPGYLPPVEIGGVVRSAGVARITESRRTGIEVGDLVSCLTGWSTEVIVDDSVFPTRWEPDTDVDALTAVHATSGFSAYFSLMRVGAPQPGETLVVSAAAGSTGSLVGQIGQIAGCRVIGIAGSDKKCEWLTGELGFEAAINHRTDDVNARLASEAPRGIDIYYDNTGGPLLDIALRRLADRGRVVLMGAIASYNDAERPPGPANYQNLISRRGRMEGYLAMDDIPRMHEAAAILQPWIDDGRLRFRLHEHEGLDSCVSALNALFIGSNLGKSVVRLAASDS